MVLQNPRLKAKEIKEDFMTLFGISVDKKMVKNALADVKRTRPADNQAFGFISSFLGCLAETNEGTTTSLSSENGVFQRAFL